MLDGPRVLRELAGAEDADVLDPLDRAAVHVGAELLIPEHRETLLEGQLEPVPAGHAVTGPVVEVLMANHTLDTRVITIRGSLGGGQHQSSGEIRV